MTIDQSLPVDERSQRPDHRLNHAALVVNDVSRRAERGAGGENVARIDLHAADRIDRKVLEMNELRPARMILRIGAAAEVPATVVADPLVRRVLQQPEQGIIGRAGDAEAGFHIGKCIETHGV